MSNQIYTDALAADIALESDFDKETAKDYLETLFETIAKTLEDDHEASVQIRDFGIFKTVFVAEREGRNLQTGEPLTIAAHRNVHFTPAKLLANSVNANYAHLSAQIVETDGEADGEADDEANGAPVPDDTIVQVAQLAQQIETPVKHERSVTEQEEQKDEGGGKWLLWLLLLLLLIGLVFALWYLFGRGSESVVEADRAAIVAPAPVVSPATPAPAVTPAPVEPPAVPPPVVPDPATQFTAYSVGSGDTLWSIAASQWQDSLLWSVLLYDNALSDPDRLEIGAKLNVRAAPDLDKAETKHLLEDALLNAYAHYKSANKNAKAIWALYSGKKQYGVFENWDNYDAIGANDRDKLKSIDRSSKETK
ncbi:hypothetical protein FACS189487_02560 [Campylobacterota bacterium]|nr:hypothetical protein FACS189487_02560 [Campylobacterota bacterium]